MRILFLTHAFNSMTQRLYCELTARGHQVSIEFDIADSVAEEAVALFAPDLIVAPFLRRAIPESIWRHHTCLVVHPGIVGDRGPSSLDRAIQRGERAWGVTVIQATAEMDAGPIWAAETFPMRVARKSSLYRNEVVESATRAVLCAVERFAAGDFTPRPLDAAGPAVRGQAWPPMTQRERAIDWSRDTTDEIIAHIHAADGFPGVADALFGEPCHLFDVTRESTIRGGLAGEVIARRETALLRATVDGAVWLGHVKRAGGIKLPATLAFADRITDVPEAPLNGWWASESETWQDIRYEESGAVGFLHFEFYNGAMATSQCRRFRAAYEWACTRATKVIVLMGGADHWSNGIHLHAIEAAESPADASWENIGAINDLAEAILRTESHLTVAALEGGSGAGGCYLARAADFVWARDGVLLNPHYKGMGNLYGSEYWTYLLPPRVGVEGARAIMQNRLPMAAAGALACGFIDARLAGDPTLFRGEVAQRAAELSSGAEFRATLETKRRKRAADEAIKPLSQYRAEEMAQMRRNFYGFDPSYHVARSHFVRKSPASWTPRHLAIHRSLGSWTPTTRK